jgi:hypothetical protein
MLMMAAASLFMYLFGIWLLSKNLYLSPPPTLISNFPLPSMISQLISQIKSVLCFIIVMLLLAADFYYLKNIAGRRLVGLRWWNEVDINTGNSHWVFESQDRSGEGGQNATDKRYVRV